MKHVVLITGSSTGIGFLTAQRLAQAGATVYASMRELPGRNRPHAAALREFAEANHLAIVPLELDVTSDASVAAAVEVIRQREGQLDVLVNNAGIWGPGMMEAFTMKQWQHYFDTNFFGCIRTLKAVLPLMRQQQRGLVVTLSSLQARFVLPYGGPNLATKWALDAATEAFKYELAPFGVEFSIVEPFDILTEMKHKAPQYQSADQAVIDQYGAPTWEYIRQAYLTPDATRAGDPHTVAEAVAQIMAAPVGSRPLRVTVQSPFPQIEQINQLQAEMQAALFNWMGLTHLLTPAVEAPATN
ncbi:SDR family NAD(P)-dependent oxidoreductase [Hymenobacter sp.]|uniref:SDR family NAD(P)-dependent oxidoreductase n=1 Tax=Hymenobacter sp. TaxID=1898978 RepID=UPI00286ADFE0|nr:SDR family NAD(P)-dependent oxidoreductase [Hymenobacter sp.]